VSRKHWAKCQQKSVKGISSKLHICDECLIFLQSKQFLPWGQLQQDQGASQNLSVLMPLLLDWKSLQKVLFISGVLNPLPPLLLPMMKVKREEEELLQETHCQDYNAKVDAGCRPCLLSQPRWNDLRCHDHCLRHYHCHLPHFVDCCLPPQFLLLSTTAVISAAPPPLPAIAVALQQLRRPRNAATTPVAKLPPLPRHCQNVAAATLPPSHCRQCTNAAAAVLSRCCCHRRQATNAALPTPMPPPMQCCGRCRASVLLPRLLLRCCSAAAATVLSLPEPLLHCHQAIAAVPTIATVS
jgi:hypothetical protein